MLFSFLADDTVVFIGEFSCFNDAYMFFDKHFAPAYIDRKTLEMHHTTEKELAVYIGIIG